MPQTISTHAQPAHTFLESSGGHYTYGDLQQIATELRNIFSDYTISYAHPLAIWTPLSDLTVSLIATCWIHQIPFVCLNPNQKAASLLDRMHALHPSLAVCDVEANIPDLGPLQTQIIKLDLGQLVNRRKSASSSNKYMGGHHSMDSIFSYFFTSGTSGTPKIVPLKRRQMHAAARASAQKIHPKGNQFWLLCMPLHHVGGVSLILRSLLYGSAIYRLDNFASDLTARLLSENKQIVAASFVPTMLKRLLDRSSFFVHKKFQAILLGGGPIPESLLQQCIDRQIPVIASFGMTETCAQIAANMVTASRNLATVGTIFEPNKIEIRNQSGKALPLNTSGQIWMKGPQIFDGYLSGYGNAKALNAKGWFNTGDFGYLDKDRQLYIQARRTDLIITGGENVSPFEVENALMDLPEVKEAAVFGKKDEEWGQKIMAVVVLSPPKKRTQSQIIQQLKKTLPDFKIPKKIIFVETLPRTFTGKIQRRKLHNFLT